MRRIWDFVKATMLGGIVFLIPVAAILVVIVKAGKMALDTVTPLAEKLPFSKGEAVLVVYVTAAIALVLLSFAVGVLARSMRIESDAVSFLEDRILNKFPPYAAVRKHADRLAGIDTSEDLKPVLVRVPNGWQIGFVVDAFSDGHVAVFIPGAPDPSSGVVQIIRSDNITPINISHQDILAWLERSGRGLPDLLARSSFRPFVETGGAKDVTHSSDDGGAPRVG
jgi:uncharacterized membrane protein